MKNRGYTTWEEDFSSERCELRGFHDELVAVVDQEYGHPQFYVENAEGTRILTGMRKDDAKRAAESLVEIPEDSAKC
jgi:hypothetical protein